MLDLEGHVLDAEALAQPGARPRRSIIFLAVSGEEKGLWGSRYFVEHPTVPLGQIGCPVGQLPQRPVQPGQYQVWAQGRGGEPVDPAVRPDVGMTIAASG